MDQNDAVCDVAIVGYGPTGMTLAALLGRAGHRVVVLERYTGLYNLPRAACFDDEIMRTFQKLGIAAEVGRGAVVQRDYDWVNAQGVTLVDLEYPDPAACGWAALYMMYQPHVETVLDRLVKSHPSVDVRQGCSVAALSQHDDGVVIEANGEDGVAMTVRARYAVGADGGGGFVRRALCAAVSDYGFQENWLVCDFKMRRSVPGLPMFRQVCDPAQPTSIVRIGPEHHRFSFMLNPGETTEEATEPGRVWTRVGRYLSRDDAELIRVANYVFRSRIAQRWRHGRVLLAGDAAHEMPPFLAQGMCSGIRDSHNLAWKLDLLLTGRAGASLLDSYQTEREPHVRFITEKAIEMGRVQTLRDPVEARARDERLLALRAARQRPEKLRFPPLVGGLIADNGAIFPQGQVGSGSRTGRFDDFVGEGWCIAVRQASLLEELSPDQVRAWHDMGGRIAVIGEPDRAGSLADLGGTYAAWFDDNACAAAVVRPDWHVYGTASLGVELERLLGRLQAVLRVGPNRVRDGMLAGAGT